MDTSLKPQQVKARWPHKIAYFVGQCALFGWFLHFSWLAIKDTFSDWPNHLDVIGIDGALYRRGALAWLNGADPWKSAQTFTNTWPAGDQKIAFNFCGTPLDVLTFLPTAFIPENIFAPLWTCLTIFAAVYIIRRLRLSWYWIAFPPLVQGCLTANPDVVALALLISGSSRLRALAPALKLYGFLPLVGERRWRSVAILASVTVVSMIAFAPLWLTYATDFPQTAAWLAGVTYGGYSATRDPVLFVTMVGSLGLLALVDLRAAAWLSVPGLWPAGQFYYSSFVMPVRSRWLGAMVATGIYSVGYGLPFDELYGIRNFSYSAVPMAIIAYALGRIVIVLGQRTIRWSGRSCQAAGAAVVPLQSHVNPEHRQP